MPVAVLVIVLLTPVKNKVNVPPEVVTVAKPPVPEKLIFPATETFLLDAVTSTL